MKISKTTINMAERRGFLITINMYTSCELRAINRKVRSEDEKAVVVEFCDENSDAAAWYIDTGSELHFVSATIGEDWPATISDEQQIRHLLPAIAEALIG